MAVKLYSWNFYEDALKVAELLGYNDPNTAIIDLYNKGRTISYLAKKFDRSEHAINIKLKKLSVKIRPQHNHHRS